MSKENLSTNSPRSKKTSKRPKDWTKQGLVLLSQTHEKVGLSCLTEALTLPSMERVPTASLTQHNWSEVRAHRLGVLEEWRQDPKTSYRDYETLALSLNAEEGSN